MPSDFEREYKEYIENSTPDFWDKIEAGITDEAGAQTETVVKADVSPADVQATDKSSYVNHNKKVIKWGIVAKRVGQFAAVAAIALISFGLVTMLAKGGKTSAPMMSDSAAPAAEAAAEAEAPAAEAAEEPMYDDMEPMAEAAEAPEAMDEAALDSAMSSDSAATEAPAAATEGYSKEKDSDSVNSLRSDENKKTSDSLGAAYDAGDASGVQIITEAVLTDITELSPTERSNSSSGDQYKYGMSFVKGDEVINCMMTEAELKNYAKNGLHLRTDAAYNIKVQLRNDYDPSSSKYPYVLKMIDDVE